VRTNPDLSVKIPEIGRKVGSKHSKRGRYAEKKANSGDCHDQQLVNTLLPRDSLGLFLGIRDLPCGNSEDIGLAKR
jgi:hypothetical protein